MGMVGLQVSSTQNQCKQPNGGKLRESLSGGRAGIRGYLRTVYALNYILEGNVV